MSSAASVAAVRSRRLCVGRRGSVARLCSGRRGSVARLCWLRVGLRVGLRGGLLGGSDGAPRSGGAAGRRSRDAASRADANSPEARPASRSSAPPKMAPPTNTWGRCMPDAAREASRIAPSGADASISTNATFAASSAVFARRQCGIRSWSPTPRRARRARTTTRRRSGHRRTKRRLGPREPREGRRTPSAATRDEATRPRAPRKKTSRGISRRASRAVCCVGPARPRRGGDDDTSRRVRELQASHRSCRRVTTTTRRLLHASRCQLPPLAGRFGSSGAARPSARGDSTSSRATL